MVLVEGLFGVKKIDRIAKISDTPKTRLTAACQILSFHKWFNFLVSETGMESGVSNIQEDRLVSMVTFVYQALVKLE